MSFETSHLIQALRNLESSSFLAYSTCKAKIEKPVLLCYLITSYKINAIFKKDQYTDY